MATMTNTMAVVIMVSLRDGQVTLRVSSRTSCRNLNGDVAIQFSPDYKARYFKSRSNDSLSSHARRLLPLVSAWQEWQDSNLQPPVLETGALPIELHSSGSGYGEPNKSPPRRCHALYRAPMQGRRWADSGGFGPNKPSTAEKTGAGERNRTVVISLEGCCSTI